MKYLFFCLTLVLAEVVCNGQTGIITTVAGTGTLGYTGDGIAATGSELSNPVAVATDRSGNFYISDQTNHRIRMVNTSGVITTIAGNGTAGYSGDGLAATNAEMHSAVGLIVDSAGNVYFVDEVSMVVRKINTSGIISTVAGNGTMGYSGDGTAASAAQLHSPTDVTMDAAGNLFIADAGNNCVRKVNTAGIISTVAGNGSSGFSADGTLATNAVFNSMGSVAVDVAGNIYIADGANQRIRKVNTSGVLSTVAGNGSAGYAGDGSAATNAYLNYPDGLKIDGAGNLYITDANNSVIRKVSTSGIITTVAGNGTWGYTGDGGQATAAEMHPLLDVAFDAAGNMYIPDVDNQRIRRISSLLHGINGTRSLCIGSTTTLTDSSAGGSWTSNNPTVATVDSGVVTGVAAGTATISYMLLGDTTTAIVTVNPLPVAGVITGSSSVLVGDAVTLSESISGGSWSCSNSHATISAGVVTGVTAGVDTISYTVTNSCGSTVAVMPVTVSSTGGGGSCGIITTVAGTGYGAGLGLGGETGDGGPATAAELYTPTRVANDAAGNLYLVDQSNNRIRKVSTSGIITVFAGNGTEGYGGDGGPATAAELNRPFGIALDRTGNVFVADQNNNRIRKIDSSGNIWTVAGTGVDWYSGDGGQATAAELNAPMGIALDGSGNMYIADQANNRIRKVNASGIISTVTGSLSVGYSGDGGPASAAQIYYPYDVAADTNGNIFIADYYNHCVRKINSAGIISTYAGTGISGNSGDGGPATAATIHGPYGITLDASRNLYVVDGINNRVRKVSSDGTISNFAGSAAGTGGYSGDGSAATAAELQVPSGVSIDNSGNVYIADNINNRVRKVTPGSPPFVSVITGPSSLPAGSTATLTDSVSGGTWSVANSHATVTAGIVTGVTAGVDTISYTVSNSCGSTVAMMPVTVSSTGGSGSTCGIITTIAGNDTAGYNGDGGAATAAELNQVPGVAVDKHGNFYVTEYAGHRIRKVTPAGVITTIGGTGVAGDSGDGGPATLALIWRPSGIAVDAVGNILFSDCDNGRVRKIDTSGIMTTIAGNGILGYSGDGGLATNAEVQYPEAITTDAAGNIYFADFTNNAVRKISTTGIITTIAGTGVAGYTGDGGPATLAKLNSPYGLVFDDYGNLFLSDCHNNVIRKISVTGTITTVAGTGVSGSAGDGGPASAAQFNYPKSILFDGSHNLLIVDNNNNKIRQISTSNIVSTIAGTGVVGYSGNGGPAVSAELNAPEGLAIDTSGNLYIADEFNNCIRKVTASAPPSVSSINGSSLIIGGSTTTLTDSISGGTWSASNGHATVLAGVVTGVTAGVDTISYTVSNSCGSTVATLPITVTIPTPSVPCYVPTSGLVAWYPFSGNANDSSGNGINGTVYGASLTTDRSGNANSAYSFDGSTNYIELPYSSLFDNSTYSFSFWVKTSLSTSSGGGPGVNQGIMSRTPAGGPSIGFGAANNWVVFECGGSAALGTAGSANGTGGIANAQTYPGFTDGTWHHIVYTVSSDLCICYKDGIKTDSNYYTVPISYEPYVTRIGLSLFTYWRGFLGSLDDIAIYNRVLSPCEISQLYNSSCTALTAGSISGLSSVAIGSNITLADTVSGGMWSVANSHATVSGGVVTGVSTGVDTISYMVSNSCGSAVATMVVTVSSTGGGGSCGIITTIAGNGTAGFSGDGGPGTAAEINMPFNVAVDSAGNVYVTDLSNRIRKVNSSGIIETIAGNGSFGWAGDGGPATAATMYNPTGVAFDNHGNIYIADRNNNVIRKINNSGIISTIAGNGTAGYSGDGLQATAAELNGPTGVAVDTNGNIYISDLANNRIRKINSTGMISTYAGTGTAGYSGDNGMATLANLNGPWDIKTDRNGNLFLTDHNNACVRKVNSAGVISTVAGNGTTGFSGDGGPATAAQMNVTIGMAVDAAGSLYIADPLNQRVRMVSPGGIISTIAGTGVAGYSGDGGSPTSAELHTPRAVAIDNQGNIYIDDYNNNRVRKFTIPISTSTDLGPATICIGSTLSFTGTSTGGVWSAANGNATVSSSGVVTGVSSGTDTILYTAINICGTSISSQTVNVISAPNAGAITGSTSIPAGSTVTLSDSVSGGAWSVANSHATVSGGVVTGVAAGVDTISYTASNSCGSAVATMAVTILPCPTTGTITGTANVCAGSSITLADTTMGGVWSCSNGQATITSGGVVTGIISGTDTISYSVAGVCGTSTAYRVVTVNPLPDAGSITGMAGIIEFCAGSTFTVGETVSGGVWSSSDPAGIPITGSGVISGLREIQPTDMLGDGLPWVTYTVSNGTCTASTSESVQVDSMMTFGTVLGSSTLCTGSTTSLTPQIIDYGIVGFEYTDYDTVGWVSSNTSIATVDDHGNVTGVSGGVATITYSVENSCGWTSGTVTVTVYPIPVAGSISGLSSLNAGTTILLTDTVTGGVWSASNGHATISGSGVVSGVSVGIDTISYTVTNGCSSVAVTKIITVNSCVTTSAITGSLSVCVGTSVTLADTSAGGTWSISNPSASVTSGGVVTGFSIGLDTVIYTYANICGAGVVSAVVTVNPPVPSAGVITGLTGMCGGGTLTLTDAAMGGTWSASNTLVTVTGGVVMAGLAGGTVTISYTMSNSCGATSATSVITINPYPDAGVITGAGSLCAGAATTLVDTFGGSAGSWVATNGRVNVAGGVVTAISGGLDTIQYFVTNDCGTGTAQVTVNVLSVPSAGMTSAIDSVCPGASVVETPITAGGVWSMSNGNASVLGGTVTGEMAGVDTLTYLVSNSCGSNSSTIVITVDLMPYSGTITGADSMCAGGTITLTETIGGGLWSSTSASVASGVVMSVVAGIDSIVYAVSNSCGTAFSYHTILVMPLADAGVIISPDSICNGLGFVVTDPTSGGTWSGTNHHTTFTDSTVSAISVGTDTLTYTVITSCGTATTSKTITVLPQPEVAAIEALPASANLCLGQSTTLFDSTLGGVWSEMTGATTVSGGVVTATALGIDTIAYTITNSCGNAVATFVTTVGAYPSPSTVSATTYNLCIGKTDTLIPTPAAGYFTGVTGVTIPDGIVVTGVTAGTMLISYVVPNTCGTGMQLTTVTITVDPLPYAGNINGIDSVCAGLQVTLLDSGLAGTWLSANPAIAAVSGGAITGGIVNGMAPGTDTIFYLVTNSCGTDTAVFNVRVMGLPARPTVTGNLIACVNRANDTLHGHPDGGTWAAVNGAVSVSSGGVMTAVAAGLDTVLYGVANSCGTTYDSVGVQVPDKHDCDSILATDVITTDEGFVLYPNPTTGIFTVVVPDARLFGDASFVITDMTGKELYVLHTHNLTERATRLDISHYPRGSYMVKVEAEGAVYRQQVVVW